LIEKRTKISVSLEIVIRLFFVRPAVHVAKGGEVPKSALVVGRIQPRPRVSIVRWNLKEGGGKSLVWRTEITWGYG